MSVLVSNKITRSALAAVALLTMATYSVGQLPAVKQAQRECVLRIKGKAFDFLVGKSMTFWAKNEKRISLYCADLASTLIDDEFVRDCQRQGHSQFGVDQLIFEYQWHGEPQKSLETVRKVFDYTEPQMKPWLLENSVEAYCALGRFGEALSSLEESERLFRNTTYKDHEQDYFRLKVYLGLGRYGEAKDIVKDLEQKRQISREFISSLKELSTLDSLCAESGLSISRNQIAIYTKYESPEIEQLQFVAQVMKKSGHPEAAKLIFDKVEELRGN